MIEVKMNDPAGVILTTAGQKCNQNIKVVPGFDIPEEYNGETELLVPTVSGVWVFNDAPVVDIETEINQTIDSVANNKEYIGICIGGGALVLIFTLGYDERPFSIYDSGPGWQVEDCQTIDFGTEPQAVSEEFYAWLTANAVKQ